MIIDRPILQREVGKLCFAIELLNDQLHPFFAQWVSVKPQLAKRMLQSHRQLKGCAEFVKRCLEMDESRNRQAIKILKTIIKVSDVRNKIVHGICITPDIVKAWDEKYSDYAKKIPLMSLDEARRHKYNILNEFFDQNPRHKAVIAPSFRIGWNHKPDDERPQVEFIDAPHVYCVTVAANSANNALCRLYIDRDLNASIRHCLDSEAWLSEEKMQLVRENLERFFGPEQNPQ